MQRIFQTGVVRVNGDEIGAMQADCVAVEEPLLVRVTHGPSHKRETTDVSVTMRTPGDDFALAAGFLWTEGLITACDQIADLDFCGPPSDETGERNAVRVHLTPGTVLDVARTERHFYTTSSCGVCGKTSLEAVHVRCAPLSFGHAAAHWEPRIIHKLPDTLRVAQAVFDQTGGLHAAALFSPIGELLHLCEDVGRHNAVDKIIGTRVLQNALPIGDALLFVSGRASFELVQKAATAGIPVLAAVGAPSSLAVRLAQSQNMTLLGFVRNARFNIYAGAGRIAAGSAESDVENHHETAN